MESRFNETEAGKLVKKYSKLPKDLVLRVYTSRLIGSDPALVLHGGGNSSVKLVQSDIHGDERPVIYVKGSGWDMAHIKPDGFTGLNLHPLLKLRDLDSISDEEMENQLTIHRINAHSPYPSVEALLHVFLPHKYIDHTHADSILILTNQKDGEELIREALGSGVAVLPYAKSGLPLAIAVVERYERQPDIDAIVILNHGIFTFASDAITSYEKMIDYISRAEAFIAARVGEESIAEKESALPSEDIKRKLSRIGPTLRGACAHSGAEGKLRRFFLEFRTAPDLNDASLSEHARDICSSGVLTPDHAIRIKSRIAYVQSIPDEDEELKLIINKSIESFVSGYQRYYRRYSKALETKPGMLDPYPRLVLVAGVGLIALGQTRRDARTAADIGEHTIHAKMKAHSIGSYEPISEDHVFDMEYWPLQLKKLDRSDQPLLQGQVALITGAGGAIGYGVAERLLATGAVVVISDFDETRLENVRTRLARAYDPFLIESIVCDVSDFSGVESAYDEICQRIGGVDIVVPNAGVAHVARIEDLDPEKLDQVIAVNMKGTFNTIKASIPVFRRQGTGGNIVVVSSKNVFDPGAAFGAYSASKAGAHQISKIAALELAELGVRVNMVNPDAIFGDEEVSSQLWDLVGPDRMKARGLDAEGLREYYRRRNLLRERVLGEHVGNAVVFFASNQTPTTGASLPVDGGIPSAFPR